MTKRQLFSLRVGISVFSIVALVARLVWPSVKLDAISLGLLIVAILPWLSDLFESLEFPGGWKVSFRDLHKAASAIPDPTDQLDVYHEQPSYLAVRDLDANLALVGLRIEIERRLQEMARQYGIDHARRGAGSLARQLGQRGALPGGVGDALQEIMMAGNAAAHGAEVPEGLENFAFDEGPRILAWLDELLESSNDTPRTDGTEPAV